MSHIEHVVSMELVPIKLIFSGFQSKDVRGAQNSLSWVMSKLHFSDQAWGGRFGYQLFPKLSSFPLKLQAGRVLLLTKLDILNLIWVEKNLGGRVIVLKANLLLKSSLLIELNDFDVVCGLSQERCDTHPEGVHMVIGEGNSKNIPRCFIRNHLILATGPFLFHCGLGHAHSSIANCG